MAAGHIPAQKYLKFTARGAQPSSIMKAWANIWSYFGKSDHPMRAYTDDFELYKSPELVEIYIAVK
jgi:predicted transcriptional regulator YdeE